MTKKQLFEKYQINESHNVWESIDDWMSVEVYRIMHNGNLPPQDELSVDWIIHFLDKQSDTLWWISHVMRRNDWGSLYLTAKRMVYRFADQLLNNAS